MKRATRRTAELLAEVPPTLLEHGRVLLCQIVHTQGSTPGKVGWKLLVCPAGKAQGNLGGGAFEAMVVSDARAKLDEAQPKSEVKRYYFTETAVRGEATGMVCGGLAEVFFDVMVSAPVLVICGGGPVGQALARAGELAGFDLLVVEDREEFQAADLFPEGTSFVSVDREFSGEFLTEVLQRDVYAAVVSRCWETDTAALAGILRQQPDRLLYLGLMGSARKVEHIQASLKAEGVELETVLGDTPFAAPIGLCFGGDSPGEIALSIIAQIQQIRYGQST